MNGVSISERPADALELGPNCPDENQPCETCPEMPCSYAVLAGD